MMNEYDPQRDAAVEDLVTRVTRMFQGGKIDPAEAGALLAELASVSGAPQPETAVAGQTHSFQEKSALAETLQGFKGITMIEDAEPSDLLVASSGQPPEWAISFKVGHNEHGWYALEFLVGAIQELRNPGLALLPFATPMHLGLPGERLSFVIVGVGIEPEQVAKTIDQLRLEYYVPPGVEVSPANSGRDCCWCSHYEDADDPEQFRCLFDDQLHPVANTTRARRCIHWLYPFGDIEA